MKHLRRDKIFRQYYYKCSPDSNSEKKFENWSIFDEVKAYTKKCAEF